MENTQRRSDFTAVVNSATDLLKDPALRELLDAIRKIKP